MLRVSTIAPLSASSPGLCVQAITKAGFEVRGRLCSWGEGLFLNASVRMCRSRRTEGGRDCAVNVEAVNVEAVGSCACRCLDGVGTLIRTEVQIWRVLVAVLLTLATAIRCTPLLTPAGTLYRTA